MKHKAKLAFEMLEKEMELIRKEEQAGFMGGGDGQGWEYGIDPQGNTYYRQQVDDTWTAFKPLGVEVTPDGPPKPNQDMIDTSTIYHEPSLDSDRPWYGMHNPNAPTPSGVVGGDDQSYNPFANFDWNHFYASLVNSSGYNSSGYNSSGYNSSGYTSDGYNSGGYNSSGYNSAGYDSSGYNSSGYNTDGYNSAGYNSDGINSYFLPDGPANMPGSIGLDLSQTLRDIWNGPAMRALVPDILSINISSTLVPGLGAGHVLAINIITRGDASVSVTETDSIRAGLHADASMNVSVGYFLKNPDQINLENYLGLGVDGNLDLGIVGAGGWVSNDGETGIPTWVGYNVGWGPGAGGSVGVSETHLVYVNGVPLKLSL